MSRAHGMQWRMPHTMTRLFNLRITYVCRLSSKSTPGFKIIFRYRRPVSRNRYRTVLQASTAMIDDLTEVPVTYLNKGQVYYLRTVDLAPVPSNAKTIQYRTLIRITFEQEKQRSDPATYWRLWEMSRGWKKLQNSNKRLTAIEYAGKDTPSMHIERISLDGFSITWTANPTNKTHECTIPIRCNFTSTDFTTSKGVSGDPVRLCVKTKQLEENNMSQIQGVWYCLVKLFRDHGAERKHSNDVKILQKKMDKLKLQLIDPAPLKQSRKRKRSSTSAKPSVQYDGVLPAGFRDSSQQETFHSRLQEKLYMLQRSISSTRPESLLGLCADDQDDPELNPSTSFDSYSLPPVDMMCSGNSSNDSRATLESDSDGSDGLHTATSLSNSRLEVNTSVSEAASTSKPSTTAGEHGLTSAYPISIKLSN